MDEEFCPNCGCHIIEGFYELDHIKYCCETCANGVECNCKIVQEDEERQ